MSVKYRLLNRFNMHHDDACRLSLQGWGLMWLKTTCYVILMTRVQQNHWLKRIGIVHVYCVTYRQNTCQDQYGIMCTFRVVSNHQNINKKKNAGYIILVYTRMTRDPWRHTWSNKIKLREEEWGTSPTSHLHPIKSSIRLKHSRIA